MMDDKIYLGVTFDNDTNDFLIIDMKTGRKVAGLINFNFDNEKDDAARLKLNLWAHNNECKKFITPFETHISSGINLEQSKKEER